MKLDYDFVNKSLDEQMMLFLENCTTNFDFSREVLSTIIVELINKCDNETLDLIVSDDLDAQKVGCQLLFGEHLYIFNTALSLHHYDYECFYYPRFVVNFMRRNYYTEHLTNGLYETVDQWG